MAGTIIWTRVSIFWRQTLSPLIVGLLGYCMRTAAEAYDFFVVGKVFVMLYSEAASETSQANLYDDAYTLVRFGERVYTNIRRFVVLEVGNGFVKAWYELVRHRRCIPTNKTQRHWYLFQSGNPQRRLHTIRACSRLSSGNKPGFLLY